MTAIIRQTSLSYEDIKKDLVSYISNNDLGWKDFFQDSSAGAIVIDMIASQAAFLVQHTLVGQREAYLPTLVRETSAIAISQLLGYSTGRGRKQYYKLTINPSQTKILKYFSEIGKYGGQEVILVGYYAPISDTDKTEFTRGFEGVPLVGGREITLSVIIGKLNSEVYTIKTDQLKIFRFIKDNVSEDILFRLFVDVDTLGERLDVSKKFSDLVEDKFVSLSNTVGGVDLFYLNRSGSAYATNNTMRLDFIEMGPESVIFSSPGELDFTNLILDENNDTSNHEIISMTEDVSFPRIEKETVDSIRISAPSQFEASNLVRSRTDYSKLITSYVSDIVSVNSIDISPAIVEVTYVKVNEEDLIVTEKEEVLARLAPSRPLGIRPPVISDPRRVPLNIKITLSYLSGVIIGTNEDANISNIISEYEKLLGIGIDFDLISNRIIRLVNEGNENYIKSVTVEFDNRWQENVKTGWGSVVAENNFNWKSIQPVSRKRENETIYAEGDQIIAGEEGAVYEVFSILVNGRSGDTEPTWPTTLGGMVEDGHITWKYVGNSIPTYKTSKIYKYNDAVLFSTIPTNFYLENQTGTNDIDISGVYEEDTPQTYVLSMDNPPNTFSWTKGGREEKTNKSIKGTKQEIQDGLVVKFDEDTSGLLSTDSWEISAAILYPVSTKPLLPSSEWEGSKTYSIGDVVVPDSIDDRNYVFTATVAGTSGAISLNWPENLNATIDDNGIVWKNIGKTIPYWRSGTVQNVGDILCSTGGENEDEDIVFIKCLSTFPYSRTPAATGTGTVGFPVTRVKVSFSDTTTTNFDGYSVWPINGSGGQAGFEEGYFEVYDYRSDGGTPGVWSFLAKYSALAAENTSHNEGDLVHASTLQVVFIDGEQIGFYASDGTGTTGGIEPSWNPIGTPTIDDDVEWETIAQTTGDTEPTWTDLRKGYYAVDGSVIWRMDNPAETSGSIIPASFSTYSDPSVVPYPFLGRVFTDRTTVWQAIQVKDSNLKVLGWNEYAIINIERG